MSELAPWAKLSGMRRVHVKFYSICGGKWDKVVKGKARHRQLHKQPLKSVPTSDEKLFKGQSFNRRNIASELNLPWTNENIFSMELCVANVTLNFSESSTNFSPTTTKSKTLYIRLVSHRPNFKSRPEKTAFSLALTLESAKTYSRHVAGVRITGALGMSAVAKWSL